MYKPTVNMTNWELYFYAEEYTLSGTADNHPALGKNAYVSETSAIVNCSFKDDVLICETKNTIYVCPLKYMITWPYRNVLVEYREELTHRADVSDSTLDTIIAATAKLSILETKKRYENPGERVQRFYEAICRITDDYSNDEFLIRIKELQEQGQKEIAEQQERENNRLIDIACHYEDCVYLEVTNVGYGSPLAYHLGEHKGIVRPRFHCGTFQDSVLYMKYASEDNPCSLDFRYFPMGWGDIMETYSWSDNIARTVIKNNTDSLLQFNKVDIPIGETMIFTPDGHNQGLISPDCHNGKSIFTNSILDEV